MWHLAHIGMSFNWSPFGGQQVSGDSCPPTMLHLIPTLRIEFATWDDFPLVSLKNNPNKGSLKKKHELTRVDYRQAREGKCVPSLAD